MNTMNRNLNVKTSRALAIRACQSDRAPSSEDHVTVHCQAGAATGEVES